MLRAVVTNGEGLADNLAFRGYNIDHIGTLCDADTDDKHL